MARGSDRSRFIFYTQKNPNFRICLPKKIPTFFSIPKKIPQCVCITKFYYLSSGKLKHASFNFGFEQNYTKANTKSSHGCYSVSSFCDNFTGRYSLWHLQHVLSLAHSLLAIVPKHPYVTDLVASDFSPCFCATDISKGGQTIPTRYRTHPYTPNRVSPGVLHRSVVKYSNSGQLNCIK